MSQFIGRGEKIVEEVLRILLMPRHTLPQWPISELVNTVDFSMLGSELNKHKFDLYVEFHNYVLRKEQRMVVEVNYKHGEKAAKKWKIYNELMKKNDVLTVTIDDYDCRDRGVFWQNSKGIHPKITWDDFRDVIDALEKAGIEPNVSLE